MGVGGGSIGGDEHDNDGSHSGDNNAGFGNCDGSNDDHLVLFMTVGTMLLMVAAVLAVEC